RSCRPARSFGRIPQRAGAVAERELRAHPPHQPKLGLEIHVVRQLQMLDESGRLDVVGVREHELLVLRRRATSSPSSRARKARSTSAMDMALRSLCPNARPYPRVKRSASVAEPLNWLTI